jgi:RNA polymerase sigma-70 factor (ECF subfamily)
MTVMGFPTTTWSTILTARDRDRTGFQQAIEKLCRIYWYPVYAYARRQGHSKEDAEDLTQEFFSRMIEKQFLQAVSEDRGRFRWFLLTALKRFLANEWNRERAKKRGGGLMFLSLEFIGAEGRYLKEPMHEMTPEKIFHRGWSLTILQRALGRLREEHAELGDGLDFDMFKTYLTGEAPRGYYSRLAADIGMTEGAVRVAVHRMRRRFGDLLRAEIREIVASEQEVDDEIRFLFEAVGV